MADILTQKRVKVRGFKKMKIELEESLVKEFEYIIELHKKHGAPVKCESVKELIDLVLYSVADGSCRPGSWERGMLESMGIIAECDEHSEYRRDYGKPSIDNSFHPGAGLYGDVASNKPILIAFGDDNCKALNKVSDLPVVNVFISFDDLTPVTDRVREFYPEIEIYICSNDYSEPLFEDFEKKVNATAEKYNATVITPKLTEAAKKAEVTSWAELAECKHGKKRIMEQLRLKIPYLSKEKDRGLDAGNSY